jgi:tyrosine-protein kinase Etk/Wzc
MTDGVTATDARRIPNHFLFLLLQNRWFLAKAIIIIMVPVIILTYILPKQYTVTTVIMPPEEQSSLGGLSLGGLSSGDFAGFFSGGNGFSLPLMTTMSDVYMEILDSRTLIDNVIMTTGYIDSVNLTRRYSSEPQVALYLARKSFMKNYDVEVTPSGFIRMEFTAKDPMYAVDVSDRILFLLDSINVDINTSRLQMSRRLLEGRVASADSFLAASKEALLQFEDTSGVVELETEAEELISLLIETKGTYLQYASEAQAIRDGLAHGSNAMIYQLDRQAAAVKEIVDMLESGETPSFGTGVGFAYPLSEIPDLAVEYARLKSDYEVALQMSAMLRVQLEQALVQENTVEQTIRLLDAPMHPGWKSKPKKLYIWIEFFLIACFFLSAYLVARDRIRQLRLARPEDWQPWDRLIGEMRNDFRRKKKRRP